VLAAPTALARPLLWRRAVSDLFKSVGVLESAMSFHRERHAVLAGNAANVDTPGYQPMDLERIPAGEAAALPLAQTDGAHAGTPAGASAQLRTFADPSSSVGGDQNSVSLERELAKIDANGVRYGACAELVSRRLALLRYTAGGGNG